MHHAGLHVVFGQTVSTASGRPLQTVADQHQHVVHATVRDLGEDVQRGGFCHSAMPSRTLSVIVETVWRDTSAP